MRKNILSGFTLIEIVVAMTIFLIIIYLSGSMMGYFNTPAFLTGANIFINSQIRQVAMRIPRELDQSSSSRIFIENGNQSIRFNLPLEYPNGTLNRTTAGDLQWGDGQNLSWWVNYYWDATSGNVTRRILNENFTLQTGNSIIISTNITYFNIQQNATQYEFNLTASINTYMGRPLPDYINSTINFAVTPQN